MSRYDRPWILDIGVAQLTVSHRPFFFQRFRHRGDVFPVVLAIYITILIRSGYASHFLPLLCFDLFAMGSSHSRSNCLPTVSIFLLHHHYLH